MLQAQSSFSAKETHHQSLFVLFALNQCVAFSLISIALITPVEMVSCAHVLVHCLHMLNNDSR